MDLAAAILLVSSAIPAPYTPPPGQEAAKEARKAFLSTLSVELASVTDEALCQGPWSEYRECVRIWPGSQVELAAAVLAVGQHESLLSERIQKGDCRVWSATDKECDAIKLPDGSHYFRAQSVFQLHGRFSEPVVGLEWFAVRNAAKQAVRILAASKARCRTWEGMFASYAGTRSCAYRGAAGRVKTFQSIESRLTRALNSSTPRTE